MKYNELVTFQPIESVIQLRDAGKDEAARRHVESYVISKEMADRISDVLIPQMQYDVPFDNKGILIVGNYGSGKSHLLSVLSSIAENEKFLSLLTNDRVKTAARQIAGKFKVIRLEIGATEMGLREIIATALENSLEEWGVSFRFPDAGQVYSNKPSFEKMMALFHERFPADGILVFVDELLDYLRSRSDHPLIKDLGFLREVGEVCKDLKFRFVAGVQEAIFDSGRFSHVGDSVRRVKERFQEIRIEASDLKFVVSNRLLKKTPYQLAKIREYLQPFSKFYTHMNEQMDEFAALFPIHPDYIETFKRIPIVEKRGVLQILSDTIKELYGQEVPDDHPGIKAYDSYWKAILANSGNRTEPEVAAVIECSSVLEAKIKNAFTRPQYQPMAFRIIDALSVHRLTTHDLYSPIGLTPEEMRDGLCLFHKAVGSLGGDSAEDLLTLVETVLREIHKTVSGQFISSNKDNRQYFLDLKKIDDYDALIDKRAESLDEGTLDRYYYDALKQVLECTDIPTHVTGYQIWQHELEWKERRAPRLGYLFFGAPNERSTAVPKRDFYLYFIQPFSPPRYKDDKLADEVFFRLQDKDSDFEAHLKRYAAALELAGTSSGIKRDAYRKKASEHLSKLTTWMQEHLLNAMHVTYQGQKKRLLGWLKGGTGKGGAINIRDTVNAVGSTCLAEHFANLAPNYPHFSILLTTASIPQAAQDAIRGIAQPVNRTKQAKAVLDALELLDGDKLDPAGSQYAREIVDLLKTKGAGQVLNRQELIQPIADVSYFLPHKFRLEPEWTAVLLAALVYSGDAVLAIPGTKFDAAALDALATTGISDLTQFKHLEQPKGWPMAAIKALFELMDLAPGMAIEVTQGNTGPVNQLQKVLLERVENLVVTRHRLMEGIPFWGQNLFSEEEVDALAETLEATKIFIEGLQAFNSPGKLKNLKCEAPEILSHKPTFKKLKEIAELEKFAYEMGQITQYLSFAEGYLPEDHAWRLKSTGTREQLLNDIRQPEKRTSAKFKAAVSENLKSLKADYIKEYFALHKKARLTLNQDKTRADLTRDYRLAQLQKLTAIDLLNRQQLVDFQERLGKLRTCFSLTEKELENDPKCSYCGFWPGTEEAKISADATLETLKTDLGKIHKSWTQALLNDLDDPVVQSNFSLLKASQQKQLNEFTKARELPDEIDGDFVQAVKEALMGLSKVPVPSQALKKALIPDGSPATPAEFRERFDRFMDDILKGKDAAKIRLVLD